MSGFECRAYRAITLMLRVPQHDTPDVLLVLSFDELRAGLVPRDDTPHISQ